MIDLHTHTNHSDGDLPPMELVEKAAGHGVTHLAITDHDTVEAYTADLAATASKHRITLIPGIELSTIDELSREKIHVLGLDIDTSNPELIAMCAELRSSRERTMLEVADKLAAHGITLRYEALIASGEIITKAHIARDVLANPENTLTLTEKFGAIPLQGEFIEAFLIQGCPAFVEKDRELLTHEAVALVQQSEGKAFCAHPSFNVMRGLSLVAMESLIIRNNFDGVEAINVQYDKSNSDARFDMVKDFTNLALRNGLLISGGSDYHSDNDGLWGKSTALGLSNEAYAVTSNHLSDILR